MTAAPKFLMLKLADVVESPLNPRKEFDKAKLAELTASVKEKGVLEPILVRPKGDEYEVAAGARRVRAAKAAELATIPAMVREMTDAELLEVALLENVVRHDITALEEGDALRALQRDHGYTVEKLIEKTGKSRTVVFQRMKLAELQGASRKLLLDGKLSASVAELLARLPTKEMQEEALTTIKDRFRWSYQDGDLTQIPFRQVRDELDRSFRLVLKKAPFDVTTKALVSGVPECAACPKRTGAQKESFPNIKEDTCLDGACWQKKEEAALALMHVEAKAEGMKVVKNAEAIVNYGQGNEISYSAKDEFSKKTDKVVGGKTWGQLLGEKPPMVRVVTNEGVFDLVDKQAALSLLREKNPKAAKSAAAPRHGYSDERYRAQQKAEGKKRKQARAQAKALLSRLGGMTLDTAVDVMIAQWGEYRVRHVIEFTDQKKTDLRKPADRIKFVIGTMLSETYLSPSTVSAVAAAAKVDLKKLQKEIDAAEKPKTDAAPAEKPKTPAKAKPAKKAKAKKAAKKGKK